MRIALAGNPNSGKTTMFNALTGAVEKVGNWAGVTVEKKERPIKKSLANGKESLVAVDLPGAYSMSPFTSEENVTKTYIQDEKPDVIINIVDASNLSRSLFFTTQLLELGIPTVIALNKSDVAKKKETKIDVRALSAKLGCPVLETVSTSSKGLDALIRAAAEACGKGQKAPYEQKNVDLSDKDAVKEADKKRFAFVNAVVEEVESKKYYGAKKTVHDKIDAVLLNKWAGIPIFAAVMFAVFWISQASLGAWIADLFASLLEAGQAWVAEAIGSESIWASLLIDGIIGGVIAVVGFLPLVMIMYFLISLLEDCGYMARVSVVLDPIFKRVGLSGKSVIPFVIGTGCAVPGVMACRTIRGEKERRATALLAPFMPCGAKLPVIALFAGAFFADAWWVGPLMYFAGIALILLCAVLIRFLTGVKHKKIFFIMELPEYRAPSLLRASLSMCQRGWAYIVKAGTVILVCNFIIHLMQNFTWRLSPAATPSESILASVGTPFAYFFAPFLGYVSWQLAAAAITGFIAKENVVGTLAVSFGITNLINADELMIFDGANVSEISAAFGTGSGAGYMVAAAAFAYLLFNLFSPPCFAAIGAMNAELKSKKWLFAGIGLQIGVGYSLAFLVYFFASLFSAAAFDALWMPILGWAVVAAFAASLLFIGIRNNQKEEKEKRDLKKENAYATR